MNKPIRTLAVFCMLLFLALLANATWLQYVTASDLNDDPRNRRVIEAAFARERGAILVGREPVAESVPSGDRFKFQRTYAQPFRYSHVTGFFSYYSQTGIERSENAILSGDDPRLFVTRLVDLIGNTEPQGGNVRLTLNRAAQDAAHEALEALGPGTRAAAVAIQPDTGKVLAMSSTPNFDPNRLASHDLAAVSEAYDQLNENEAEPLLNRTVQTTQPPGSTFKLVTAAAALESGNYANAEAMVRGGSSFQLPQSSSSIGNHDGGNCGGTQITMTQAMRVSCNVSFLALADELGPERMGEQAAAFGFNSTALDELPQAESRYPDDLDAPQTAMSGIGQSSVTATPLQMAMVAAGIANDGVVMKPYLVDEVRSPDLVDVLDKTEPRELSQAVSPRTAEELTKMLVATVDSGTARPAAIPGVKVAGKTGTAQRAEEQYPVAWFVSFAPAEDPQVAVAVMVEDAQVSRNEIGGGRLGGPIAKAIMEAVIDR